MVLGLIVQPANLMPDKLAEPNQDRSAVTQGATGCNFGILTELSLARKTRSYIILSTLIQNCVFKAAVASPVLEKK